MTSTSQIIFGIFFFFSLFCIAELCYIWLCGGPDDVYLERKREHYRKFHTLFTRAEFDSHIRRVVFAAGLSAIVEIVIVAIVLIRG